MSFDLSVEQEGVQSLGRALKEHTDGKKLRRDLSKNMRGALDPAVEQIKAGLMAISSSGGMPTVGEPLRAGVAKKIKAQARLSGRATGARIRARKTQSLRGFANAPKRLNSDKGWRHPTFGDSGVWVTQMGNPGYFDDPIQDRRDEYRDAVLDVMEDTARQIAREGA